jgi:hypothetical protein
MACHGPTVARAHPSRVLARAPHLRLTRGSQGPRAGVRLCLAHPFRPIKALNALIRAGTKVKRRIASHAARLTPPGALHIWPRHCAAEPHHCADIQSVVRELRGSMRTGRRPSTTLYRQLWSSSHGEPLEGAWGTLKGCTNDDQVHMPAHGLHGPVVYMPAH